MTRSEGTRSNRTEIMEKTFRFTASELDRLPLPEPGRRLEFRDEAFPPLVCRVTADGTKTFAVAAWSKAAQNTTRVTLGTYKRPGDARSRMTVDMARKAGAKVLAKITDGTAVNTEKKAARMVGRTVGETLDAYIAAGDLKPRTVEDYRRVLTEVCSDWLDKPITGITRDAIRDRHRKHSETRSKARADNAVRVLRALFNFAVVKPNPASSPKKRTSDGVKGFLNNVGRKRTLVKMRDFPAWWSAVENLQGRRSDSGAQTLSDFLLLLVLTGLRFGEAAGLLWSNVDRRDWTIKIPDTKNGDDHELPVGPRLVQILERRWSGRAGPYVFPAQDDPLQPYPLSTCYRWLPVIEAESGIKANPHDLRRTFATCAESMDVSALTVKRLLNHRTGRGDVTEGYVVLSPERLRGAMRKIEARMLAWAAGDFEEIEQ
jgi:integrase